MKKDLLLHGAYLLMVGLLAWNVYQLRSRSETLQASVDRYRDYLENPVYRDPALPVLPDSILPHFRFDFINREGALTTGQFEVKPQLLVVFTPDDCGACFAETPFWERLRTAFGDRVEVVGIVSGRSAEESARFLRRRNINIPVACDSEGRLLDFLRLRNTGLTPVKVFVSSEGKALHRARTTYSNALAQLRYSRALHTLLDQQGALNSGGISLSRSSTID